MTVWNLDTSKQVGDRDHLKVFESVAAANENGSRTMTLKAQPLSMLFRDLQR